METEQHLRERNQIAASLGQEIVLEQLRKFREQFISQMKTMVTSSNDPYGINLHRYLGRIEAIDYLINQGEQAIKPSNNKKDN